MEYKLTLHTDWHFFIHSFWAYVMQYINVLTFYYFVPFHTLINIVFRQACISYQVKNVTQKITTQAIMNFERKFHSAVHVFYCSGMGGGWLQTEEGDPPQFFIYPPLILLCRPLIGSLGSTTASPSPHPNPLPLGKLETSPGEGEGSVTCSKWGGGWNEFRHNTGKTYLFQVWLDSVLRNQDYNSDVKVIRSELMGTPFQLEK